MAQPFSLAGARNEARHVGDDELDVARLDYTEVGMSVVNG